MSKRKSFVTISCHKWSINKTIINIDSSVELKEINIKNCSCYYFDDIIEIKDFNLGDILIDEESYENILVNNIAYKTLIKIKHFSVRLDEKNGFIRDYDGTIYLVLFKNNPNIIL